MARTAFGGGTRNYKAAHCAERRRHAGAGVFRTRGRRNPVLHVSGRGVYQVGGSEDPRGVLGAVVRPEGRAVDGSVQERNCPGSGSAGERVAAEDPDGGADSAAGGVGGVQAGGEGGGWAGL